MVAKIVLTGGPCAGKTTCLRAIRAHFGEEVVTVPEAATLVLGGGLPPPGHERICCPRADWVSSFQATILALQQTLEESFEQLAHHCGVRLIVCDRGVLDGAAYWPDGRAAFLRHFGLSVDDCFARYRGVLHLQSLAQSHPHLYGPAGNLTRYEDTAEALRVERAVRAAWEDHPGLVVVAGEGDLQSRIQRVLERIRTMLTRA